MPSGRWALEIGNFHTWFDHKASMARVLVAISSFVDVATRHKKEVFRGEASLWVQFEKFLPFFVFFGHTVVILAPNICSQGTFTNFFMVLGQQNSMNHCAHWAFFTSKNVKIGRKIQQEWAQIRLQIWNKIG